MPINAILFDKDGTLVDFGATFAPATKRVIEDLAMGDHTLAHALADAVEFEFNACIVKPGSVLIAGSVDNISDCWWPFSKAGSPSDFTQRIDRLFVKYSTETLAPFPYLNDTLDKLATHIMPLGVATNDSHAGAMAHLGTLNIVERFNFIAGSNSGHGEKPGPGMVLAFAEACGLPPAEIAMVGDSPHDCLAGRAAGAISIGVTCGGAEVCDLAPHADHVLKDISELPALIEELNQ